MNFELTWLPFSPHPHSSTQGLKFWLSRNSVVVVLLVRGKQRPAGGEASVLEGTRQPAALMLFHTHCMPSATWTFPGDAVDPDQEEKVKPQKSHLRLIQESSLPWTPHGTGTNTGLSPIVLLLVGEGVLRMKETCFLRAPNALCDNKDTRIH